MNVVTFRVAIGDEETRDRKVVAVVLCFLIVIFFIVWLGTGAHFMADTNVYAEAILRHQHSGDPVDYRSLTSNPFWDFGHVLWRPFGWLCFVFMRPATWLLAHSEQEQVILTLIGINIIAALASVCCFFLLARRIVGHIWPAALATLGLLSADAFLNYSHSGNAYVVGVAWLVAGMYFSFGQNSQASPMGTGLLAAVMFAFAALFWFPYVFVLPAAIAVPILIDGPDRQRWRAAVLTVVACAVIGMAAYTSAIAALGTWHPTELKEWVLASGHGQIQAGGFRAVARLAFSLPRSFLNMGRDGMWLKRYLVHDPYAPVTLHDLFRLGLWKLILFYLSAAAICIGLSQSRRGRMVFLLLAFSAVPIFAFSVFIFEAGSIERYLPLYPFVFLAFAYVLADRQTTSAVRALLILAVIAMAAVNINSGRKAVLESQKTEAMARIKDLVPVLDQNSLVLAVNEQDSFAEFRHNFPLDPINVQATWQTYDMLEINAARLPRWREDFATRALAIWQRGGTVWLPERVFHGRPRPEWNWVEGDDNRVKWTDIPSFFSQFEIGSTRGGEDGFVLLKPSSKNKDILGATIQKVTHD